jgi:hypothetical protein
MLTFSFDPTSYLSPVKGWQDNAAKALNIGTFGCVAVRIARGCNVSVTGRTTQYKHESAETIELFEQR